MRSKEIKVGHIYYVNFEPTRRGEFPDKHLAVVLKKNHDKISFVVIPLTGSENGKDKNKVDLGNLEGILPHHLANKNTYAVYDQIRTLSASRFECLMEDGEPYDSVMPADIMRNLYEKVIVDLLYDVSEEERKMILKSLGERLDN